MFIGLLNACIPAKLGESLVSSSEGSIRYVVQHESCECKCWLNISVCNPNEICDHGECWFECKELNDCSSCKEDYIWSTNSWDNRF